MHFSGGGGNLDNYPITQPYPHFTHNIRR